MCCFIGRQDDTFIYCHTSYQKTTPQKPRGIFKKILRTPGFWMFNCGELPPYPTTLETGIEVTNHSLHSVSHHLVEEIPSDQNYAGITYRLEWPSIWKNINLPLPTKIRAQSKTFWFYKHIYVKAFNFLPTLTRFFTKIQLTFSRPKIMGIIKQI